MSGYWRTGVPPRRPCSGDYADKKTGPWEGLKQAREYGTLFYRSREEYNARFNCEGLCHDGYRLLCILLVLTSCRVSDGRLPLYAS